MAGWAEPVMKMYPNAQMDLVGQTLSCLDDVEYVRIGGIVTLWRRSPRALHGAPDSMR